MHTEVLWALVQEELCWKYPVLGPSWRSEVEAEGQSLPKVGNQNGFFSHLVKCFHYVDQCNFTDFLLLEGRKMG